MHYAFVDESGTETPFGGNRFLVIALVCVSREQDLTAIVKRTHKKFGSGTQSGELKAAASPEKVRRYMLEALAAAPVEVVVTIVDKRSILRPPDDSGILYRAGVAKVVRNAATIWPNIDICLDRRYSAARLRDLLDETIRVALLDLPEVQVLIRQEDSISRKTLQAADFVAWALHRKYEQGKPDYYEIVSSKIVSEELFVQTLW